MLELIEEYYVEVNKNDLDEFYDCPKEYINKKLISTIYNPKLRNVYCIGINTLYTDRIIHKKNILEHLGACCISNLGERLCSDVGIKNYTSRIPNGDSGTVWFNKNDIFKIYELIDVLENFGYCRCCNIQDLNSIKWYRSTINRDVIMAMCTINTSSGKYN